jgi:hypothetical protein
MNWRRNWQAADETMKILREAFFYLILIGVTVFLSGCGYTTGSLLPSRLKTIYVDNFKNKIDIGKEVTESARYTLYRPGLETDATNEIVNRFVFDGNLMIASKENADLILRGSLVGYHQEALRYDTDDNVEEYRIKIAVDMELTDVANDELMWRESYFIGEATYMTVGRFATSEDTARDEALEDLARRIVERTVEGW